MWEMKGKQEERRGRGYRMRERKGCKETQNEMKEEMRARRRRS